MLRGLYTEKALYICLGNFLAWSGSTALADSFVTKPVTADSFLKASHITQARNVHQITAVAISVLQKEAFEVANENANENSFEELRQRMIKFSATFWFWLFILKLEALVLVFVRSHRESNIDLYTEALKELMVLYFFH